jgi:hypothetical protein
LREKRTSVLETFVTVITLQEKLTAILCLNDTASVLLFALDTTKPFSSLVLTMYTEKQL